jgi:hypothetical protein
MIFDISNKCNGEVKLQIEYKNKKKEKTGILVQVDIIGKDN